MCFDIYEVCISDVQGTLLPSNILLSVWGGQNVNKGKFKLMAVGSWAVGAKEEVTMGLEPVSWVRAWRREDWLSRNWLQSPSILSQVFCSQWGWKEGKTKVNKVQIWLASRKHSHDYLKAFTLSQGNVSLVMKSHQSFLPARRAVGGEC